MACGGRGVPGAQGCPPSSRRGSNSVKSGKNKNRGVCDFFKVTHTRAGKVFYFRKFICQHQKRGHLATMFLLCEFGRKVIQFDKKRQRKTVPCRKNIQKQCFVSFWDKINKTLCAEATNFTEIGPSLVYFWQNLAQPDSIFGPSENSVGPKIESGPGRVS